MRIRKRSPGVRRDAPLSGAGSAIAAGAAAIVIVIGASGAAQSPGSPGTTGAAGSVGQAEGSGSVDVSRAPGAAPAATETVEAVRAAERRYSANKYDGSGAPGSVHFVDRTATSLLVFVAPHAVRHHRAGKLKAPELYTGGIAEVLGERLGASVLSVDGLVPDWGDDWAGRDDKFTRILHGLPPGAIIVDLHGMRDSSADAPFVLGTGRSTSETTTALRASLREELGAEITDEGRFGARAGYTVVDHMQRRDHPAIQIEIAYGARDPETGRLPDTVDRLSAALAASA